MLLQTTTPKPVTLKASALNPATTTTRVLQRHRNHVTADHAMDRQTNIFWTLTLRYPTRRCEPSGGKMSYVLLKWNEEMSRVYNCSTGFRARSKARRGNVPRPHDACKLQKCLRLHPLFCRITFNYNFLVHVYVSLFTTIVASVRTAQRSSYTALGVLA